MKKEYPKDLCPICGSSLEYCITEPDQFHPQAEIENEYICFNNIITTHYQNHQGEFVEFDRHHYVHYTTKEMIRITLFYPPYSIRHYITEEYTLVGEYSTNKKYIKTPLWSEKDYANSENMIKYIKTLLVFS